MIFLIHRIETMKPSVSVAVILIFLFCVPVFTSARQPHTQYSQSNTREGVVSGPGSYWERSGAIVKRKKADTLQVAGSRLPDCSHACGSCTPCRLVIVSFVCASRHEAEPCPISYKCMCNNKSYPVP